ncbi:MAG: hypothetical protein ABGX61_01040, partial [Acidimicrobiales bacterium]
MKKRVSLLTAVLLGFALIAGACGSDDEAGGELTMCRANWASGYIQAEIVRQIVEEAGFTVS